MRDILDTSVALSSLVAIGIFQVFSSLRMRSARQSELLEVNITALKDLKAFQGQSRVRTTLMASKGYSRQLISFQRQLWWLSGPRIHDGPSSTNTIHEQSSPGLQDALECWQVGFF